jgi:intracellular sulfur oxidation DsrE/DsrF family protein
MKEELKRLARRSFLTKAGLGAAFGAALGAQGSSVAAQSAASSNAPFQPARHAEDDWLELPGKHRVYFDATSADGFGLALLFGSNFYDANKNSYGVDAPDLAVVIGARHRATAFTYTDEIWAKYGKPLSDRAMFTDPKTKEAPAVNVYRASGYGAQLSSSGVTLDPLIARGVRFAVCQLSTRANASLIARATGGNANAIYEELASHLLPNARIVPAGVVAVTRAQERGYSLTHTG